MSVPVRPQRCGLSPVSYVNVSLMTAASGDTDIGEKPNCARCGRPVIANEAHYELFERMHWVCFHFEFEHEGDPDVPCGDLACPIRADPAYPPDEDDHMRCRVCGLRQKTPPWGRDG